MESFSLWQYFQATLSRQIRLTARQATISDKIFETKYRNSVKLDRTRKAWYLLLRVFWLLLQKFNFWKRDWALGYISTEIWDFPNVSLFL